MHTIGGVGLNQKILLKVLLPYQILIEDSAVTRVVVETPDGAYGILPNRLDCVATLTQGIMVYETDETGEIYVALDEGILVKTGNQITVSVRNAFSSPDLGQLEMMVEKEFKNLNEREKTVKMVISKLESDFMRRYVEIRHD